MKSAFKYFVIASSLPATIWPILGLAMANARRGGDLNFLYVTLLVPFLFGFFNVVSSLIKYERNKINMLITGLILGLVMASVGTYSGIPQKVYGLTGSMSLIVFIGGPLFYGAVWCFVVHPLEKAFMK